MPRRKQAKHTDVKDIRSILRLTFEQGLSIRAVSERLKISKTSVSTYLLRAKEAGLAVWPLPPGLVKAIRLLGSGYARWFPAVFTVMLRSWPLQTSLRVLPGRFYVRSNRMREPSA